MTVDIVVVLRNVGHRVRGLSEHPAALDQPQLGRGRCGRGDISTARAHWLRHLVKDSLPQPSSAVHCSHLYFLYSQCLLAVPTRSAYSQCLLAVPTRSAYSQCLLAVPTRSAYSQCLLAVPTRPSIGRTRPSIGRTKSLTLSKESAEYSINFCRHNCVEFRKYSIDFYTIFTTLFLRTYL